MSATDILLGLPRRRFAIDFLTTDIRFPHLSHMLTRSEFSGFYCPKYYFTRINGDLPVRSQPAPYRFVQFHVSAAFPKKARRSSLGGVPQ